MTNIFQTIHKETEWPTWIFSEALYVAIISIISVNFLVVSTFTERLVTANTTVLAPGLLEHRF